LSPEAISHEDRPVSEPVFNKHQPSKQPGVYEYRTIQESQGFRLLRLEPGKGDDPIHCSLFEVGYDNKEPFEAISYRWGKRRHSTGVICDGGTISVTCNLVDALQTFRQPDVSRILWADALCIDQQNLDERSSQVQLMTSIYSRATKVLIWLAHGDRTEICTALDYICWFCQRLELNRSRKIDKHGCFHYHWAEEKMEVLRSDFDPVLRQEDGNVRALPSRVDDRVLPALRSLLDNTYFRRGWIVQEVALPARVEMHWGKARINFDLVCRAAYYLHVMHRVQLHGSRKCLRALDGIHKFRLTTHKKMHKKYRFSEILSKTSRSLFTDPRDYLYGMLGLQNLCIDGQSGETLFQPDYKASVLDCYKRVTETMLCRYGDLGFLALVDHRGETDVNWPSWVPRLHQYSPGNQMYEKWNASKDLPATASKVHQHGRECIRMGGFRMGRVQHRHIPETGEEVRELFFSLQHQYTNEILAWTVTAGVDNRGEVIQRTSRQMQQHTEDFTMWLRWDHADTTPVPKYPPGSVERVERFQRKVTENLGRRTYFTTAKGLFARGPAIVEVGDEVVLLFGGKMFFILRPVGALWRLVGQVRIYGLMMGEAVDDWRQGTYTTEDFLIF
jgi:hypothetical protein